MLKQLRLQSILNKGPVGGLSNRTQKNIYFQTNIHKVIIAFAWPQPKQSCRCGGVAGAGQGRAGGGASTLVLVSTNLSTLTYATRHYYAVYPLNETSSTPRAFLLFVCQKQGQGPNGLQWLHIYTWRYHLPESCIFLRTLPRKRPQLWSLEQRTDRYIYTLYCSRYIYTSYCSIQTTNIHTLLDFGLLLQYTNLNF